MKIVVSKPVAAACVCLAVLAGCMSTSPTHFRPIARTSHFDLIEDAVDGNAKNMLGEHLTQTLKAGHYTATFEDESYVYYECADTCVLWGLHPASPVKGGLGLPKPGSKAQPYLWVYVVRSTQNLGLIGNLADKTEAGNIRLLHYGSSLSKDFLQSILVQGG